jgi:tetratricopeptide (TPR) repeat protein
MLATIAAYSNTFTAPFVFDDYRSITNNPTIRQLWPIETPLCPPSNGQTVSGRPLLNLSLALNYAAGGCDVLGYHVTNLAIHLAAALLLFGIVRRTAAKYAGFHPAPTASSDTTCIALAVAVLWAVHPLQTESVTYVVQRAESLMGFFYLLTLYCFLRGAGPRRAVPWFAGSVLACLLGMATKEVMVSAPVVVLLYDRTFLSGSFRAAWRCRWGYYISLAATWLLLAWLVTRTGLLPRCFGTGPNPAYVFTPWTYLAAQPGVLMHYLRQAFWPSGLCLDYCWLAPGNVRDVIFPGVPIVGLLGVTGFALVKKPEWGFLGAWFFLILAPTSSVLPVQGSAAFEHRMYLPLAAVVSSVVAGACLACERLARRGVIPRAKLRTAGGFLAACAVGALGTVTFVRNATYQTSLTIWQDTVAKAPWSDRAQNNLGMTLEFLGRPKEAINHYRKSLEIRPDRIDADSNLRMALFDLGQVDEALKDIRTHLPLNTPDAEVHYNFGLALHERGRIEEAVACYNRALQIRPDFAETHNNLAAALAQSGRLPEAIAEWRKSLGIDPHNQPARENLKQAIKELKKAAQR